MYEDQYNIQPTPKKVNFVMYVEYFSCVHNKFYVLKKSKKILIICIININAISYSFDQT